MFQVRAFEARTISWWYQRKDDIEFAPPFQRSGRLWSASDKSYLIDSIVNEYDFPKLYLADFSYVNNSLNRFGKKFAVIDGRQRLEAIFDFIEDKFPLSSEFVYEGQPDIDLRGLRYSHLRSQFPKIALLFEQFNLPVMSVITDDEAKINQLFVRMNRNKPLTGAEIRNAMEGAVPPSIRRLVKHEFFDKKCAFTVNRGQDKNVAAKLLLLSHSGEWVNTKKSDLDSFVKRFVDSFEASTLKVEQLKISEKRASKILDSLSAEFSTSDPRLRSSGLIPVYFKVVEEYGSEKFGEFLNLFNTYLSVPEHVLSSIDYVDETFKLRVRSFHAVKRSVNDSYALNRMFAILSGELLRYRSGLLDDAVRSIGRITSDVRAYKNEAARKVAR